MSGSQVGTELSRGRTRWVQLQNSPNICILSPEGFHEQLWAGLPWEVLELRSTEPMELWGGFTYPCLLIPTAGSRIWTQHC